MSNIEASVSHGTHETPCERCTLSLMCMAGRLRVRRCARCDTLYAVMSRQRRFIAWAVTKILPCTHSNTLATGILKTDATCPRCWTHQWRTVRGGNAFQ